jgi:magnesium chelatase subunit I
MDQEQQKLNLAEYTEEVPPFMSQIIAEITQQARHSPDINQRSGVSVRASVANFEALMANALRRSISIGEQDVVPRISDLPFIMPSLQGKIEFEAMEDGQENKIMENLFSAAIKSVFERFVDVNDMEELSLHFTDGIHVTIGESVPAADYVSIIQRIDGLDEVVTKIANSSNPSVRASAAEFILEGLHINQLLNKDRVSGRTTYRG